MDNQLDTKEIALKYLPHFMEDEKEPFPIQAVGYSIFTNGTKSQSCNRLLKWNKSNIQFVVEYAVFFDFDIQHLYDLEHVFVYVGVDGSIVDIELSFHGKFIRGMIDGITQIEMESHPIVYMQPGKHAMVASPEYFQLCIALEESCNELSGADGFLIAPMFETTLCTDENIDKKVEQFIEQNYTFTPSMKFKPSQFDTSMLMPYDELEAFIIRRMNHWKDVILNEQ
jgi:hypothetical protein